MNEWASKQNLLLFEVLQYDQPWTMDSYRKTGGYSTWSVCKHNFDEGVP